MFSARHHVHDLANGSFSNNVDGVVVDVPLPTHALDRRAGPLLVTRPRPFCESVRAVPEGLWATTYTVKCSRSHCVQYEVCGVCVVCCVFGVCVRARDLVHKLFAHTSSVHEPRTHPPLCLACVFASRKELGLA